MQGGSESILDRRFQYALISFSLPLKIYYLRHITYLICAKINISLASSINNNNFFQVLLHVAPYLSCTHAQVGRSRIASNISS